MNLPPDHISLWKIFELAAIIAGGWTAGPMLAEAVKTVIRAIWRAGVRRAKVRKFIKLYLIRPEQAKRMVLAGWDYSDLDNGPLT